VRLFKRGERTLWLKNRHQKYNYHKPGKGMVEGNIKRNAPKKREDKKIQIDSGRDEEKKTSNRERNKGIGGAIHYRILEPPSRGL